MNARIVGATRWVARTEGEAPPRPYIRIGSHSTPPALNIPALLPIEWVRNGSKVFGVRTGQGFLGHTHLSFPRKRESSTIGQDGSSLSRG